MLLSFNHKGYGEERQKRVPLRWFLQFLHPRLWRMSRLCGVSFNCCEVKITQFCTINFLTALVYPDMLLLSEHKTHSQFSFMENNKTYLREGQQGLRCVYIIPYNLQNKQKRISGGLDLLILIYRELTECFCLTAHLLKKRIIAEKYMK